MKAKILDICFYNKTRLTVGEIVEIVPNMETDAEGIWNAPAGKLFLCKKQDGTFAYSLPQDLQFLPEEMSDTNWSMLRAEAAKMAMLGLLASSKTHPDMEYICSTSVRYADELINELITRLKEEEEEE